MATPDSHILQQFSNLSRRRKRSCWQHQGFLAPLAVYRGRGALGFAFICAFPHSGLHLKFPMLVLPQFHSLRHWQPPSVEFPGSAKQTTTAQTPSPVPATQHATRSWTTGSSGSQQDTLCCWAAPGTGARRFGAALAAALASPRRSSKQESSSIGDIA